MDTDVISIICADDDRYMRDLYEAVFTRDNYSLRTFADGSDVIQAHQNDRADLMILDIDMPGHSGLAVCEELRRSVDGFNVPIILVSGRDTEKDIGDGFNAGADDYIVKPFKPPELLAKATILLRRRNTASNRELGLPLGSRFVGRYEIVKKIGSGGFSSVYRASDVTIIPGRDIALKILEVAPSKQNDDKFLASFQREVHEHSMLIHPNIVALHDFGRSGIYYFLAMEFLTGETLHAIIDRHGKLTTSEVVLIGHDIARALEYLASCGVSHRDIKPRNIMRTDDGPAKLLDFGITQRIEDATVSPDTAFQGTIQFAAPERLRLEAGAETASDIFSLGATLYYSITGIQPFSRRSLIEACHAPSHEMQPPPACTGHDSISRALSTLIDAMLAPQRADRPSIARVTSELKALISASPPPA